MHALYHTANSSQRRRTGQEKLTFTEQKRKIEKFGDNKKWGSIFEFKKWPVVTEIKPEIKT